MSLKALVVIVVLGIVAWSRPGQAEKVKTNQSTKVYSRAGEQSPVVLKVKSGQTMTLLARDGRWLKVRVSGRTGWVPRSTVDLPDDDEELTRNTRRRPFVDGRGTKRGFGGESGPEDRVGADATGDGAEPRSTKADEDSDDGDARPARKSAKRSDDDGESRSSRRSSKRSDEGDGDGEDERSSRDSKDSDDSDDSDDDGKDEVRPMARVAKRTAIRSDPDKDSEEAFTADPRTALYVLGEKGSWTSVENDQGDVGWVQTSKLEIETAGGGRGGRIRLIDVRARLGVALVHQSVSTKGGMNNPVPDNYGAGSSSVTVALGASVLVPYSRRYWIGGELAYDYNNSVLGGIAYQGSTIGFTFHNFNLRALGGYDLQSAKGTIVFARLGYHYDSFQVSDVNNAVTNTLKLPSQIVSGPAIGAAVLIPRLTKDIGLRVSVDTMLFGAGVQQTKGLEDGTGPSAKAFFLGGCATYRWKPRMDLQATYDLGYTSVSFAGPPPDTSMRGHTAGTTSAGSGLNHTLSGGIAYAF